MDYKIKIIDLHEKWLKEESAFIKDKEHSMEMAVSTLDKHVPFSDITYKFIDKRFIKIKKQGTVTYLYGINPVVTKALQERHLTIDYIEVFLNKNTVDSKRFFGNFFEFYILTKFCSLKDKGKLDITIFPNMKLDYLQDLKDSFRYEGQGKKVLVIVADINEETNYFLTTCQSNFPIFNAIFISKIKHFVYICVKAHGLQKLKNQTEDYSFEQSVKKNLNLLDEKVTGKLNSYSKIFKEKYSNCI